MLDTEKDHVLDDAERQQVNDALEAVLATEKFEAAPQMSAFLRYVVAQAADGNQSRIKAFTVAVDALGKPDSFDPQNDPVVRVLAGRLRAALTAYNEDNPNAPVIITMTPGSYVPSFKRWVVKPQDSPDEAAQPVTGEVPYPSAFEQESTEERVSDIAAPQSDESVSEVREASPNCAPLEPSDAVGRATSCAKQNRSVATYVEHKPGTGPRQSGVSGLLHGSSPMGRIYSLFTVPKALITCAIAGIVWVVMVQNFKNTDASPSILAATPLTGTRIASPAIRARPSMPAVFISAINQGNALENSLNSLVSSVISESEQVQAFRILETESDMRFWPEDYILALTALDLPDERQVNMQLIEADTGRIVHSQSVSLKEQADDQLTQAELTHLIDAAQEIVSKSGPLMQHYTANQRKL